MLDGLFCYPLLYDQSATSDPLQLALRKNIIVERFRLYDLLIEALPLDSEGPLWVTDR